MLDCPPHHKRIMASILPHVRISFGRRAEGVISSGLVFQWRCGVKQMLKNVNAAHPIKWGMKPKSADAKLNANHLTLQTNVSQSVWRVTIRGGKMRLANFIFINDMQLCGQFRIKIRVHLFQMNQNLFYFFNNFFFICQAKF